MQIYKYHYYKYQKYHDQSFLSPLQVLKMSQRRWGFFVDMWVVVELTFRIHDLVINESCELFCYGSVLSSFYFLQDSAEHVPNNENKKPFSLNHLETFLSLEQLARITHTSGSHGL